MVVQGLCVIETRRLRQRLPVEIHVQRVERLLRIETSQEREKNCVSAVFADTGVGIPEENLPKLFEPFFSTKKKGKGVGLGLSVAYGIIQEHGGSIHVQSKKGRGTTFAIELPLKTDPKVFHP